MVQRSTYLEIILDCGEAVSLRRAQGSQLYCVRGKIWITETNGTGDVVLTAGNVHSLSQRGRTVIQSVGKGQGATCRLSASQGAGRISETLRRWAAVLWQPAVEHQVRAG